MKLDWNIVAMTAAHCAVSAGTALIRAHSACGQALDWGDTNVQK